MTTRADIIGTDAASGIPGEVRALGQRLDDAHQGIESVLTGLQGLTPERWVGLAASAFEATRDAQLPVDLRTLSAAYGTAAGALLTFSSVLDSVQQQADALAKAQTDALAHQLAARSAEKSAAAALGAAKSARLSASHDPVASVAADRVVAKAATGASRAASTRQSADSAVQANLARAHDLRLEIENASTQAASKLLSAGQAGHFHWGSVLSIGDTVAAALSGGAWTAAQTVEGWLGLPGTVEDILEHGGNLKWLEGKAPWVEGLIGKYGDMVGEHAGQISKGMKVLGVAGIAFTVVGTAAKAYPRLRKGEWGSAAAVVVAGGMTLVPEIGLLDFATGGAWGQSGVVSGLGDFYADVFSDGTSAASDRASRGDYGPVVQGVAKTGDALGGAMYDTYESYNKMYNAVAPSAAHAASQAANTVGHAASDAGHAASNAANAAKDFLHL